MSNIKEVAGVLIRETRKRKGLTQRELGEKLGLTISTITKYEGGKQNLSLDTINAVFEAMGVKLELTLKE